jgi:hypothetical protein
MYRLLHRTGMCQHSGQARPPSWVGGVCVCAWGGEY